MREAALLPFLLFTALQPAIACSCYGEMWVGQLPEDGAVEVPIDVVPVVSQIVIGGGDLEDVELIEIDSGEVVPVERDLWVNGDNLWGTFTPVEPLTPGTNYELIGARGQGTFRTSDDPTLQSAQPASVGIADMKGFVTDNSCGAGPRFSVNLDRVDGEGVHYEVQVAFDSDFEDAQILPILTRSHLIGDGGCSTNIDGIRRRKRTFVRARAVSATGEPGPWGDRDSIVVGSVISGCAHGSSQPLWLWWAGLFAFGVRLRGSKER